MRFRVWAKVVNSGCVSVELYVSNEENAEAIARAWMVAHPEDQVFLEDTTGINPLEVFMRAGSELNWLKGSFPTRKEIWPAKPAMGCVEPGSVHDIVDLSRLA
jgi:hypothetical protein